MYIMIVFEKHTYTINRATHIVASDLYWIIDVHDSSYNTALGVWAETIILMSFPRPKRKTLPCTYTVFSNVINTVVRN